MLNPLSKEAQKEYWDKNMNKRSYKHPVVRFFATQRINFLKKAIDFKKIKNAFEVGCGDGFASYYMGNEIKDIEAGDISELMLKNNPLKKVKLRVIDAENLNLPDNSFDLVFCWEVLHHLNNPEKGVKEMARVSKSYVVCFEPNRNNILQFLFSLLRREERGTLKLGRRKIEHYFNNAGLKILKSCDCGKVLPNKTPLFLLKILKKLPFISSKFISVSVLVVGEKQSIGKLI